MTSMLMVPTSPPMTPRAASSQDTHDVEQEKLMVEAQPAAEIEMAPLIEKAEAVAAVALPPPAGPKQGNTASPQFPVPLPWAEMPRPLPQSHENNDSATSNLEGMGCGLLAKLCCIPFTLCYYWGCKKVEAVQK